MQHWGAPALATLAALVALAAVGTALALKPWRALPASGPPWPWVVWAAVMPWLWSADLLGATPLAQPLPGACLLLLMAGWPLATLAFLPVAAAAVLLSSAGAEEALARLLWLGIAPATLALALGALVRRALPHHLFVYILGRGFAATLLANMAAGTAQAFVQPLPPGLQLEELLLARWLMSFGDAIITGMMVAVFVAFRPHWLAIYTDRLYLPAAPPPNASGDRR